VLGYLHRGVEKICENGDWHHAISNCDPLEYIASMFSEAMPVLLAEKLLDLEVPRRAEYLRVLAWELNRISSHALFIGWLALDLGGLTPILYGFIERDEIVEMLASLTGQKLLFNYLRIGGVNGDLNHEFLSRLGDWMSHAVRRIEDQTRLINENEIFVGRTRGLGVLTRRPRSGPGVTAALRAHRRALRRPRAHPYSVYPELEFDIPTRTEGDSYARYLLHSMRSARASGSSTRCLHEMPDGPIDGQAPAPHADSAGRAWIAIESPRGQYGCYAMSDGSDQPFRCASTTRRTSTCRRSARSCRATSSPTRWRSWPASTRSWAGSISGNRKQRPQHGARRTRSLCACAQQPAGKRRRGPAHAEGAPLSRAAGRRPREANAGCGGN
jgi:NADH-quinone oxidoreductase subunit D